MQVIIHSHQNNRHGSVTFDVMQGLYGLFIIDQADEYEADRFVPQEQEIELLIGYAWLHDKVDCVGTDVDPTLKFRRPFNTSVAEYPFAFPIQSVCLAYTKMADKKHNFSFTANGEYYTQTELSNITEYPVTVHPPYSTEGGKEGIQLF